MGARGKVYPILTPRHSFFDKGFILIFNNIFHRLADIFGKKPAIGTGTTNSVSGDLKDIFRLRPFLDVRCHIPNALFVQRFSPISSMVLDFYTVNCTVL